MKIAGSQFVTSNQGLDIMHMDISDEKGWVQCNWTEIDLGEALVEKGVVREDIVLGFIPAEERKHTGYAA